MAEKRMIDANWSFTINATDNTGYNLAFGGGIISVFDKFGHCVCEFFAEDAPAADAVEVRHGKWIEDFDCGDIVLSCSLCDEHYWISAEELEKHKPNYCPNCGAKMDGERKENNHG